VSADPPPPAGEPGQPKGPDLAREALARARETAANAPNRWRRQSTRRGRGLTGPGPDPRDPQPLGKMVRRLVEERGWSDDAVRHSVVAGWPELVGPEVAAHCQATGLNDGELLVVAESNTWAAQLRLLAPTLLKLLAERVGHGVVRRIRVTGPTSTSPRRGPRRAR
jgi:predicted nucleic acid-binding Zn ribbon protein